MNDQSLVLLVFNNDIFVTFLVCYSCTKAKNSQANKQVTFMTSFLKAFLTLAVAI
jgi:hypothetical protein